MKTTAKKMSVFQLTTMVAANMLGAGIIMLPTNLAQVGTISVLSWLVTAVGALLLAYIFAQAGMFFDLNATQTSQVTIVLLWFAAILNFRGNRFTGRLSNMTIWGSIVPVLLIGTIGWYWFDPSIFPHFVGLPRV